MDILRGIAHDSVCAVSEAVMQTAVCHHAKILCLINNHMTRLTNRIRLLDALINIRKRCQIIHIKCVLGNVYIISLFLLSKQKIPVKIIHRALPIILTEIGFVFFIKLLALPCRKLHFLTKNLIFILGVNYLI